MIKSPIRVAITGAAGQIGYSLLFRIASGAMFGPEQPVILHLIEIPVEKAMASLNGVCMELDDCAFPLLRGLVPTASLDEGFKDVNWALLVGAVPRRDENQERKELLGINGNIFTGQGQAIAKNAAADVRVLVVGNPCNTNALIAANNARGVPGDRFFAMTMLDENRAKTQLAKKAAVDVTAVSNLAIWGNHSATMYPDFFNTKINGRPVPEVIGHREWLEKDFITTVQQRGAAIIKARGVSSAASAANAVVDTVRNLTAPTKAGDWFSVGVNTPGDYGIEKGLIFSYPIRTDGKTWEIVQGVPLNDFSKAKIAATEAELKKEKSMVADLLPEVKSRPKIGTVGELAFKTEAKHAVEFAGDGMPAVLSTPMLIGFIERTARDTMAGFLDVDERSVGVEIEIRHLAPTLVGGTVHCTARIIQVDERRVDFQVEARDAHELIARGLHKRAVIRTESFNRRVQAKMG